MNTSRNSDIIIRVSEGEIRCPVCRLLLIKDVTSATEARDLTLYCKRCRRSYIAQIENLNVSLSQSH